MNSVMRGWTAGAVALAVVGGFQLSPAVAQADPAVEPQPAAQETPEVLRNVVYRARIDGVSRGATITYSAENDQTLTANPTMVPGRVFEVNTVLPETGVATMKVSVQWPYSANLHCEVLVDGQIVAQADDFVAPRFLPQDPDYAALTCEAPVASAEAAPPAEPAPPGDPADLAPAPAAPGI
ncbi:hypothetical protein [Mycolicibacterium litorale]|uniref:Uncharacterized protein n=1 Tax=Mycolicibacterium litorale TaxID=758802 RepID=A0AAD1MTW3_9MYCO|nr:hypothetical protein [Mycolicibacterium litorale]MCV7414141.1 hypothetical protein [Mycolicibacterium litorale]TDY02167.1 hypothetical protein BCL50_4781 [Mycolicibacterium litorale]BBY15672.1 hypothetical protein MLIT_12640 [Mycolicibacterium litorale]